MIWSEQLYYGLLCRKTGPKIRKKIEQRKVHPCVFLVTLPQSEHTVLEMIPSLLLLQEEYPSENLQIIGMGATKKEAETIAQEILDLTYQTRGDCNVSAYIAQMDGRVV